MKRIVSRILFATSFVFFIQASVAASMTLNSKDRVTLVEYYDYECPHCRKMESIVENLEKEYSNLHVIYRVTPLLTPESRSIASVVLAAKAQNKKSALKLHLALMRFNMTPTLSDALRIANKLDLSSSVLFYVMQRQAIQNQINHNIKLADTYAINGAIYLPIFVFSQSNKNSQTIVLRGEQSRALLSAIVRQLGDQYVSVATKKKAAEQPNTAYE